MLATISTTRRPTVALRCDADNPPLNYVDPTGTTQAGNPLTNLFAGGYSGGTVASPTFVNPYVGSTSIFATPAIPNFNANLGLSNYNSSPLGPTNFISSLVTPPAPSFVSAFGSGTGIVSNLDAISSSLSTFRYPTREEYAYAEANPHGRVVRVETVEGYHAADVVRSGFGALANFVGQPLPRFPNDFSGLQGIAAGTIRFVGNSLANDVEILVPPSEPTQIIHYTDGTRQVNLTAGPDSRHLFQQGTALLPTVLPRESAAPTPRATPSNSRPNVYNVRDNGIDLGPAPQVLPKSETAFLRAEDPRVRPSYNPAAPHSDHPIARVFGGEATRTTPAAMNLRKGGLEGELRKYENYLIRNGMEKTEARQVIADEIQSLSRDVNPAPFSRVFKRGFTLNDIDQ